LRKRCVYHMLFWIQYVYPHSVLRVGILISIGQIIEPFSVWGHWPIIGCFTVKLSNYVYDVRSESHADRCAPYHIVHHISRRIYYWLFSSCWSAGIPALILIHLLAPNVLFSGQLGITVGKHSRNRNRIVCGEGGGGVLNGNGSEVLREKKRRKRESCWPTS
jgi:hypothetical protein